MQKIIDMSKSMEIPGPGAYDSDATMLKPAATTYGFGRSKRSLDLDMTTDVASIPGPGKYNPKADFIKPRALEIAMNTGSVRDRSKEGRDQSFFLDKSVALTPGPGTYHHTSTLAEKAHTFGTRPKDKEAVSRAEVERANLPGPGTHNPETSVTRERPRSALILASARGTPIKGTDRSPGPTAYVPVKEYVPKGPTFTGRPM